MTPSFPQQLLIAEDEETDVLLLKRSLKTAGFENEVRFVSDGEEAIAALSASMQAPLCRLPSLVILDLKMPRIGGLEVLKWMRQQPIIQQIPVVIFSSSTSRREVDEVYAAGASAYLLKPPTITERAAIACFLKSWLTLVVPPSAAANNVHTAQSILRSL